MTLRILLLISSCIISFNSYACGTIQNWMDAYEGIETGNTWRDSMGKLGSLYLMMGCSAGEIYSDQTQQNRLANILQDAWLQASEITDQPVRHYEISKKATLYRQATRFESMLETIYRRFNCLPLVSDKNQLHQRYSRHYCPNGDTPKMRISAKNGGRARAYPGGPVINNFRHGETLNVLEYKDSWYKVWLSDKFTYGESRVIYVHHSIVKPLSDVP